MTIREGRAFLIRNRRHGAHCPCCGRYSKIYKRKLTSAMARALIHIYKRFDGPFHVQREGIRDGKLAPGLSGEYAKLRHWGLFKPTERRAYWQMTKKGEAFVEGVISVPRHIFLLYGKLLGYSADETNIRRALGDRFNYNELMRA